MSSAAFVFVSRIGCPGVASVIYLKLLALSGAGQYVKHSTTGSNLLGNEL